MAFPAIRKFVYQNPTGGKIYSVRLNRDSDATIDGVGVEIGTGNSMDTTPHLDSTVTSFVVLTANAADVFGAAAKTDAYLIDASIYNASNKSGTGAAISTLLT